MSLPSDTESPLLTDYRNRALDIYTGHGGTFSDGDIDIDQDATVSLGEDGAYVKAWVFVPKEGEES